MHMVVAQLENSILGFGRSHQQPWMLMVDAGMSRNGKRRGFWIPSMQVRALPTMPTPP